MKNLELNSFGVQEIDAIEMTKINGGGSGSENGAYIAGRIVRAILLAVFDGATSIKG